MEIDDQNKVQVLLKLLDQNARSIEWVKEFDYKIAYQTLFLYAAIITFAATTGISDKVRWVLFATVYFVMIGAVIFLVRNHLRHLALVQEDSRIRNALLLTKEKIYGSEPVLTSNEPDLAFHLGRILYIGFAVFGSVLAGCLVRQVG